MTTAYGRGAPSRAHRRTFVTLNAHVFEVAYDMGVLGRLPGIGGVVNREETGYCVMQAKFHFEGGQRSRSGCGSAVFSAMHFIALCVLASSMSAQAQDWPTLKGPYLGQKPPRMKPKVFAPGIVSLDGERELNSVFSPDGRTFMFSRIVNGVFKMYFSVQDDAGVWSRPRLVGPSRTYPGHSEVDMMFAPGGKRLYFISDRPLPGYSLDRHNIWYSDIGPHGLHAPVALGPHINGPDHDLYPMLVGDGSLYFSSNRADTRGRFDSYRTQFRDGRFEAPVNLGPAINSEYDEGDIFVNANETILIHNASGRPDSLGQGDLYVSFAKPGGRWTNDVHLGKVINTKENEYCPQLTPDGKYFFFTRGNDLMWVDARVLNRFRK